MSAADNDIAAFEKRAQAAETQIKSLTTKFEDLKTIADNKLKTLEAENAALKAQLQNSGSTVSSAQLAALPFGSVPKGHTGFSWGIDGKAVAQSTATLAQTTTTVAAGPAGPSTSAKDLLAKIRAHNDTTSPSLERTPIGELIKRSDQGQGLIGKTASFGGWVKTLRLQGGGRFAFVELNDGSSFANLQVVVDKDIEGFAEVSKATVGASVWVEGEIVAGMGAQKVEVRATKTALLGACDAAKYPLAKKQHTLEHLREVAHLRPRTNTIGAVARVRNQLSYATHKFFQENGFLYVHTPLITASDCEGAGELFSVTTLLSQIKKSVKDIPTLPGTELPDFSKDFFSKPAFLTCSGQLNGENYACALSNIYTFGPTFRAEDSHTVKHLAEFWMIEPEMAFVNLADNINVAEAYLKFCVAHVLENCADDLAFFEKMYEKGLKSRLTHVLETPFVRITYTEAVEALIQSKKQFIVTPEWGIDLGTEHERYLAEEIFKKPIVVTDYPKEIKAFYMKLNDDKKTVAAMDVLVPKIGEIIGGSQREERYDVLLEQIKGAGLSAEDYKTYLDLRRFGTVMHSGFGLGFERMIMFVTGIENIRDVIPFPRWPGHAEF